MLIFDEFKNMKRAEECAVAVRKKFKLEVHVCASQSESNKIDIFPFMLDPPIVLIERSDEEVEDAVITFVEKRGGKFAGT